MIISRWESLKAYAPSINFWLQFNPTFLANKITSHLVHQILADPPSSANKSNELTIHRYWEKLTAVGTQIQQIASRYGLHQQNLKKLTDLSKSPGKASLEAFEQIFEHVRKTLFNSQKYHENLASGKTALQNGSFKQAETLFAECLKAAQGADLTCEREAAVCLAEVYVQEAQKVRGEEGKRKLIKAAGLFNYALNIAKKEKIPHASNFIWARLKGVEEAIFSLCEKPYSKDVEKVLFSLFSKPHCCDNNCHEKNRTKLRAIRQEIKQEMYQGNSSIAGIQKDLESTTVKMKAFSAELLSQALLSLGKEPCSYAMIGFGSLARGEMTPYSDLEFAFLVEDEKFAPFFRDLTYLLHFKVLCLGETILPALGISTLDGFTDCITSRGFAFDGSGVIGKGHKTPLGKPGAFELIHPPKEMASFQGKKENCELYWFEEEPYLPMELQQYTWIDGNDDAKLADEYGIELEKVLNQPYKGTTLRFYMAQKLLVQEDLATFGRGTVLLGFGRVLNIKKELYRLPHLFLQRLCLFHQIKEESSWKKIDALRNKEHLQPKVAQRFQELFATTLWYRFTTYIQNNAQNESENPLLPHLLSGNSNQTHPESSTAFQDFPQLAHLYSILMPMVQMMSSFSEGKDLTEMDLYDCSNQTLGSIYLRLMQFEKAKEYYSLAVQSQPDNLSTKLDLLSALFTLNEYQEALDLINPVLNDFESSGIGKISREIAHLYILRGKIYSLFGQTKDALASYQLVSKKFKPVSFSEKSLEYFLNFGLGEVNFTFGDMQKSKDFF